MDVSTKFCEDAKPLLRKDNNEQVGWWWSDLRHFDYSAEQTSDGVISIYVEWGDDQGGDMMSAESWDEVKRNFETLRNAFQKTNPHI